MELRELLAVCNLFRILIFLVDRDNTSGTILL